MEVLRRAIGKTRVPIWQRRKFSIEALDRVSSRILADFHFVKMCLHVLDFRVRIHLAFREQRSSTPGFGGPPNGNVGRTIARHIVCLAGSNRMTLPDGKLRLCDSRREPANLVEMSSFRFTSIGKNLVTLLAEVFPESRNFAV